MNAPSRQRRSSLTKVRSWPRSTGMNGGSSSRPSSAKCVDMKKLLALTVGRAARRTSCRLPTIRW
jgi:hypothetical protein